MLIALSSSDRSQTILSMRSDQCVCTARGGEFPISRPKAFRPLRRPKVVFCPRRSDHSLDVESAPHLLGLNTKIQGQSCERGKTQTDSVVPLTQNWQAICQKYYLWWFTQVMSLAGFDTSFFKAHYTRGAGVSKAKRRGANPNQNHNTGRLV